MTIKKFFTFPNFLFSHGRLSKVNPRLKPAEVLYRPITMTNKSAGHQISETNGFTLKM